MPFIDRDRIASVSDADIIRQLIEAGQAVRRTPRVLDVPAADDPNQLRWVRPSDVGYSGRRDQRLVERLKGLSQQGLIARQWGYYRAHSREVPSDEVIAVAQAAARQKLSSRKSQGVLPL